ncbi:unnamed protein product [Cyprideis torosa]|uniref:Succinate dehydrogenase assembly factor 2, mitochondrial n=1 Tax=Cyprideis torosa TaxID=163714 RepID=A0A7R8WH48_9CRUS|nr:unnamed protein product [Cyprideis torosa]CAG0898972.1 unnamed protein product [Cyprideis torosa]
MSNGRILLTLRLLTRNIVCKRVPLVSRRCLASLPPNSRDGPTPTDGPQPMVDFDEKYYMESTIPAYQKREGEDLDEKRARLLYQSRKRGMLENGLLLSTFAAKHLAAMSEVELDDYDKLINQPSNDWDIYYWVTGAKPTPVEFQSDILDKFKQHVQNDSKEERFRQPDLRPM